MRIAITTALTILSLGGFAYAQTDTATGNKGGGDWTPAKCEAQLPAVKKYGESCVKIKALDKRQACVHAADSKFPPGLFKSCGSTFDPLQTELMAEEKKLYPTQATAFDHGGNNNGGPNNGPNGGPGMNGGPNGGPGMNGGPTNTATNNGPNGGGNNQNYNPADWNDSKCQAQIPKVTKGADACMKKKDAGKRAECFDKVGKQMPNGFFDACRTQVEPLKQAYMTKEKQLYPNQPSGIDHGGNNNGGPNNGPNGGPGNMANNNGPNGGPNNGTNGGPGMMNGGPTGTATNGGPNGGPGMNGGPTNTATNGGPNGGPGMNGGPTNTATNGGPNGGGNNQNFNPADWNDSKCQAQIPKATKGADACIKMKDAGKRAECFDQIGKQMPNGFFEACRTLVEPIKQAYMTKEKQLYPNQPSGIDHGGNNNGGPNNGPNGGPGNMANNNGPNGGPGTNGGPGMMNGKKMDCGKVVADTKAKAIKCLAIKTAASRKECGDKVGQTLGQTGADQACHDQVNQLHQDMMSQEKQKYPTQDSVL